MDNNLKQRIYDTAKKEMEGGCSPASLQKAFAKDYVSYMTEGSLVSTECLISSIGFRRYTDTMVDFVKHFEFEKRFVDILDLNLFKMDILKERMDGVEAMRYYYTHISPMPEEHIEQMVELLKTF